MKTTVIRSSDYAPHIWAYCAMAVFGCCFVLAVITGPAWAFSGPIERPLAGSEARPSSGQGVSGAAGSPSAVPTGGSTTSDSNAKSNDDSSSEWVIALVSGIAGAFIGALFTLIGERLWASHVERKTLATLLTYLGSEVTDIRDVALRRAARSAEDPFPFDPPLSTSAWAVVRESDVAWRLISKDKKFLALSDLYSSVDDANHKREVASQMFGLSQTGTKTDDDEAQYLLRNAQALVSEPYARVAERAEAALKVLPTREDS